MQGFYQHGAGFYSFELHDNHGTVARNVTRDQIQCLLHERVFPGQEQQVLPGERGVSVECIASAFFRQFRVTKSVLGLCAD